MSQEIIVRTSFREEVDLAAEMREWQEFVAGEGYSVELEDKITGGTVIVRYSDDGWGEEYLSIKSNAPGALFDRVAGRVVRTLAMYVGELKVR